MKNIFLIALLFLSTFSFAQRGIGGRGQQQNQNRQSEDREPREFKASEVAGIFFYDVEKALKKLKIKDDKKKLAVSRVLKDHNFKIKEIQFLNSEKFNELNELINSLKRTRRQGSNNNNGTNSGEDDIRKNVHEVLRPIRNEVNDKETVLNENLENLLSKKQFKKWLKYQKKQKAELEPKRPERRNNRGGQQGQGQRRQGQRGGF